MCISLKHQYEVLAQSDTFSPFLFHSVMLKDSRYVVILSTVQFSSARQMSLATLRLPLEMVIRKRNGSVGLNCSWLPSMSFECRSARFEGLTTGTAVRPTLITLPPTWRLFLHQSSCVISLSCFLNVFQALPTIHSAFLSSNISIISVAIRHHPQELFSTRQRGLKLKVRTYHRKPKEEAFLWEPITYQSVKGYRN